jgi:hypothetical protein
VFDPFSPPNAAAGASRKTRSHRFDGFVVCADPLNSHSSNPLQDYRLGLVAARSKIALKGFSVRPAPADSPGRTSSGGAEIENTLRFLDILNREFSFKGLIGGDGKRDPLCGG